MKIKPISYRYSIASCLGLCGLLFAQISHAEPASEYKVKAAFLYNFIQLTEWPKATEETLRLCLVGKNAIDDTIGEIDGNEANRRRIKVVRLEDYSNIDGCEILFFAEADQLDIRRILNKLGGSPVLTISDNLDAAKSGVMINMFPDDRRLAFSVNVESAKRAHLTLSSRLVRLAKYLD